MQRAWAPLGVRARGAAKAAQPAQRAPRGARRGGWYRRARAAAAGVTPGTGAAQQVMQDGGRARARALGAGAPASELGRRCSCAGAGAGFRPGCEAMAAGGARRSGCCAQDCTAPATVMQREWPSTTTRRAPSSCAGGPTRPGQRGTRVGGRGGGGVTAAPAAAPTVQAATVGQSAPAALLPADSRADGGRQQDACHGCFFAFAHLHERWCAPVCSWRRCPGQSRSPRCRPPCAAAPVRPSWTQARAEARSSESGVKRDRSRCGHASRADTEHRPCADRWRPRERTPQQRWGARVG